MVVFFGVKFKSIQYIYIYIHTFICIIKYILNLGLLNLHWDTYFEHLQDTLDQCSPRAFIMAPRLEGLRETSASAHRQVTIWIHMGVSINEGYQKCRLKRENPTKMDDLGGIPILGNPHMWVPTVPTWEVHALDLPLSDDFSSSTPNLWRIIVFQCVFSSLYLGWCGTKHKIRIWAWFTPLLYSWNSYKPQELTQMQQM